MINKLGIRVICCNFGWLMNDFFSTPAETSDILQGGPNNTGSACRVTFRSGTGRYW